MSVPHIAITGGRGRLAPLAARFLQEQGCKVTLFSRQPGQGCRALEELLLPEIMQEFSGVLHAAWSTVPFTSQLNEGIEERDDFPLLRTLLDASSVAPGSRKFIFLSTAAVYGNTSFPIAEDGDCRPLGAYARAKLAAEKILLSHPRPDHLVPIALRVTNVVGFPSDPARPQGIVPRLLACARRNLPLEIWGDGQGRKDYIWIDDFLGALGAVFASSVEPGILNVGSGRSLSLLQLLATVEKAVGCSLQVVHRPHFDWDVREALIDSSAMTTATGWQPGSDVLRLLHALAVRKD